MRSTIAFTVAAALVATLGLAREPRVELTLGELAPDFTLRDLDENEVSLSALRGKTVVLEWYNPECPFVRYSHTEGPLRDMGNGYTDQGIVWLAINSGAQGRQGHGLEKNRKERDGYAIRYPILLDPAGSVGKAYGARTTPHMFVIDAAGRLIYRGGLDNSPLGDTDGPEVINHVRGALADLAAKRPVAQPRTRSYGCAVKYAN